MRVDEDGEGEGLAGGGGEIAGKGAGFAERAGLGGDAALERAGEAMDERAVGAGEGERGFVGREPGLGGGEGEQLRGGAGGDEVLAGEAGAVVEEEVGGGEAGVEEEGADEAGAFNGASMVTGSAVAESVKVELGVEIGAEFEGIGDVLRERERGVGGQDLGSAVEQDMSMAIETVKCRIASSTRVSSSG